MEADLQPVPGSVVLKTSLNNRLLHRLPIADRTGALLAVSRADSSGRVVRFHPNGGLGLPVLGYLDSYGRGLEGIEYSYDAVLASSDRKLVDALFLSIDIKVQAETEKNLRWQMKRLKADRGCEIIMDLENGQILAMASLSKDNTSGTGTPEFSNYGIREGLNPWGLVINLAWLMQIQEHLQETGHEAGNLKGKDNKPARFKKAFNVPWHWIDVGAKGKLWTRLKTRDLARLPMDQSILKLLIRLGMGQPTGIDLPGEQQGGLPVSLPVSMSESIGSVIDSGFNATPLQTLCVFSAIIKAGTRLRPSLAVNGGKNSSIDSCPGLFDVTAVKEFLKRVGNDQGPSIASVTMTTAAGHVAFQTIGMGVWPSKSPRISYISVLENARIDASQRRGTLGRTSRVARLAGLQPSVAGPFNINGRSAVVVRDVQKAALGLGASGVVMPDLKGKSMRSALEIVSGLGLKLKVKGAGLVRKQYPKAGKPIKKGDSCTIICKR